MDRFTAGFLKSLWLIRDYLPKVIITGGWAPFVYYQYLLGDKSKKTGFGPGTSISRSKTNCPWSV